MDIKQGMALANKLRDNIKNVIIGQERTIQVVIAALFAGGHVLLEDVPGTGKTVLARALSRSIDGGFARIQCTPDLLPGDITGQMVYNPKEGTFSFSEGPLFTNILLADEINRATPRSQSALLECMQEKQVTVSGETRALPLPFFVIATQNPVEMMGTFPLPEAQLDRFLVCVSMGYPNQEESLHMLKRFAVKDPLATLPSVTTAGEIAQVQQWLPNIRVSDRVSEYLVEVCLKTRTLEEVALGASPRGLLALMRACQAWALVHGREYVVPEDVIALASDVLAHRLVLSSTLGGLKKARELIRQAVSLCPVPTE